MEFLHNALQIEIYTRQKCKKFPKSERFTTCAALIGYAREYELGGNVEASPFNVFFANFDECEVLDPDDVSEALMDCGIM